VIAVEEEKCEEAHRMIE
jgi:hypothetical protein